MDVNLHAEAEDETTGSAVESDASRDSQSRASFMPVGATGDQRRMGLRSAEARSKKMAPSYAEAIRQGNTAKTPTEVGLHDSTRKKTTRAEDSRAEAFRAEVSRAEDTHTKESRARVFRAEVSRAEGTRAEVTRAEENRAEPTRAEPTRAEPTRAEQNRAEPNRAEPTRAEAKIRAEETLAEATRAEEIRVEEILAEANRAEAFRAEEARTEERRQEIARAQVFYAETARLEALCDTIRANAARAEAARADVRTRVDEARAEATRAEAIRAEEIRAEESRAEEFRAEAKTRAEAKICAEAKTRAEVARAEAAKADLACAEATARAEAARADAVRAETRARAGTTHANAVCKEAIERADAARAEATRIETANREDVARIQSERSTGRRSVKVEEQMRGNSQFSNLFQCIDKRGHPGTSPKPGDSGWKSPPQNDRNSSPNSQRSSRSAHYSGRRTTKYQRAPTGWDSRQSEEEEYPSGATSDPSLETVRQAEMSGTKELNQVGAPPPPQWGGEPPAVPPLGVPQVSASAATQWQTQASSLYGPGGMPYWNGGWNPAAVAPPGKSPELEALEKQVTLIQQRAEEAEKRQKEAENQRKDLQEKMEAREREIRLKLEVALNEQAMSRAASSQQLTVDTRPPVGVPLTSGRNSPRPDDQPTRWDGPRSNRDEYHSEHHMRFTKPDRFDGVKVDWPEYRKYFDILASMQQWSESQKAQSLAVALSGGAQTVLLGMTVEETKNYDTLVQRLEAKYDPAGREIAHRAELRNLKRKADQGPAEWASLVERLVMRAYPESRGRSQEITILEHFISGITDSATRQWLELKGLKTVPEAINGLIHYESVMSPTPKGEMSRKPRETVVAMVEEDRGIREMGSEEQLVAMVGAGQTRYQGPQSSNQNFKPAYRNPAPRPYYQGPSPSPKTNYQAPQTNPGYVKEAQQTDPSGKESLPNRGIIQMFRAQERKMGDQSQTMNGQGEKLNQVLEALTELVRTAKKNESVPEVRVEKSQSPPGERKPWERTPQMERKCWKCQQPGHLFRDCPAETSIIGALEMGLERAIGPNDIGDQPSEN